MGDYVELKKLSEILSVNFLVPEYQRGYRWKSQQVTDLLGDIGEFMEMAEGDKDSFYCLQPLVVKETISNPDVFVSELPRSANDILPRLRQMISSHVEWEVIDGQQRLTTAYLILAYLFDKLGEKNASLYALRYVTRESSAEFLKSISGKFIKESESNIDFWHMYEARSTICDWFERDDSRRNDEYLKRFLDTILNKVQFIWYETSEKNPIRVFTRLNIGKIPLTNAELIKALFLSKVSNEDIAKARLRQMEIATQWDEIENRLQDDEFWLFVHEKGFDKSTRIDFVFDIICQIGLLDEEIGWSDDKEQRLGNDRYRTFRYFQAYFKSVKSESAETPIQRCWARVKDVYDAFDEWYSDLILYHYVGYLISCSFKIEDILERFLNDTKGCFLEWVKSKIDEKIACCRDLRKIYDVQGPPKTQCLPLLLLHNVQTIINQNLAFKQKKDYEMPVFYKFPFHLYKMESWNVEHIDSNTENGLTDRKDQEQWLKAAWCFLTDEDDEERRIRNEILAYLNGGQQTSQEDFEGIQERVMQRFRIPKKNGQHMQHLTQQEKNMVWNFTLLDEHTNKSYGNAIFPVKKTILLGKDCGVEYVIRDLCSANEVIGFEIVEEKPESSDRKSFMTAFVPLVTKSVFLKGFGQLSNNPYSWDRTDAQAYQRNIYETLNRAGFRVLKMGE